MKTSLFSLSDGSGGYLAMLTTVKGMGFDAIELFNRHELAEPDVDAARYIAQEARNINLAVSCLSVGADLSRADNSEQIHRLKQYIDVTAAAGSPYLHFTLFPRLKHRVEVVPFYKILDRIILAVHELCDYAAGRDVKCVCEDQGFYMNGSEPFDRLLHGVDHANLGLVADLGNILYANETAEAFVGRFAPHICHVHVKDYFYKSGNGPDPGPGWKMTREGDFLQNADIGRGIIPFEKIFRILIAAGYDGYYSIESNLKDREASLRQELDNMRLFYENAQRMMDKRMSS